MNEAERLLSQVERDRIATYVTDDERRQPWWQSLGFAAAGGVALAAMDIEPRWLAMVVALGVAMFIGALARLAINRAGEVPRVRTMPASLRRVLIGYWVVALGGLAVILAWAFTTERDLSFVWGGGAYFVLVVVAGWITDVLYRRKARRLAEQAGIEHG